MVESDGQRFRVRLMGVLCAPLDAKSPARNAFARHFDLSEDEVANLAKLAQEFTAGYLEGKPLRLLARPDKEKDGTVVAWVFLPEVGLFQNVLIDQGLAAVHQPPAGVRRPGTMRGLLGSLMERERAAKRQGSGAWALAGEDKP